MRIPRIYTHQPLKTGRPMELEERAARHLAQVLRMKPDSPLILFNGDGCDYRAKLVELGRRSARVEVTGQSDPEPLPRLRIHLGIGLSKGDRMDIAIQKAVELGVSSITPLITARCVVKLSPERMERRLDHWRGVLTGACEQSGRRRPPELADTCPLVDWLEQTKECTALVLDHRGETTLDQLPRPKGRIRLLVGPEGGLTDVELNQAMGFGLSGIRLGPRVLRTETAPLAAIAAMQMLWGDFGQ